MEDNTLKTCSVSVKENCILYENNGKRSMIRFHHRDIQYLAHLTDRNLTSATKIKYLHLEELCRDYKFFAFCSLDKDSLLKVACIAYEWAAKRGIDVDFSIFYELAKGKKNMEPAAFQKNLKENEKVQAVVEEVDRHSIHYRQLAKEGGITSEYFDSLVYTTAAYLLCLLDTLAKQGQRFKENPKFDNSLYNEDRLTMLKQSNELADFINDTFRSRYR